MSSTAKGSLDAGGAGVPRCPQCKQYSTRREWFAPQWRHGRAVVLGQQGGDYVCCKPCYNGGAMVLHSDNPTTTREDANARALCHHMSTLAQIMLAHVDFVEDCKANPAAIREFESKGAETCMHEGDPKQSLAQDGRWTFDPRNRNYEEAFWLAWPQLAKDRNRTSLGNILEAIWGMRSDVKYERQTKTMELCAPLDEFVYSVYQVTQYTESEPDALEPWLLHAQRLSMNCTAVE